MCERETYDCQGQVCLGFASSSHWLGGVMIGVFQWLIGHNYMCSLIISSARHHMENPEHDVSHPPTLFSLNDLCHDIKSRRKFESDSTCFCDFCVDTVLQLFYLKKAFWKKKINPELETWTNPIKKTYKFKNRRCLISWLSIVLTTPDIRFYLYDESFITINVSKKPGLAGEC